MEMVFDIGVKTLMATYTICLPILIAWVRESKKEKKVNQKFMTESVNSITESVNRLSDQLEMNEAMTSRYRIIRAADEIRNGFDLSEDHIEQLGEDLDIYDTYCARHPEYKNHKGQHSRRIVLDYEQKITQHKGENHEG